MLKKLGLRDLEVGLRKPIGELNSFEDYQIAFLCRDNNKYCNGSINPSDPIMVLSQATKTFRSTDSKLLYICEVLWRIGRKDIARHFFLNDFRGFQRYMEDRRNSQIPCFR